MKAEVLVPGDAKPRVLYIDDDAALSRLMQKAMGRLGYDLLPATPEWDHRPLSARERERLLDGAAETLAADLAASGLSLDTHALVREFWSLVPHCPGV